jgi:hypothetical protein
VSTGKYSRGRFETVLQVDMALCNGWILKQCVEVFAGKDGCIGVKCMGSWYEGWAVLNSAQDMRLHGGQCCRVVQVIK